MHVIFIRGVVLEDTFWSLWPWPRGLSPRKLAFPRLEDSTIFWNVKILWSAWKIFWKTFFSGDRLKNFCEDLFFLEIAWKIFVKTFFFFFESTCACVLGPWPWPRAFLSLASRVSVLGKAVLGLGLGFFCVLGLGLEPCVLDSTSDFYIVIYNQWGVGVFRRCKTKLKRFTFGIGTVLCPK